MADNPYSWMDLFEAGMPQYVDPPQPASGGVAPPPAAKPVKAPIKKLAFKKTTANPAQFSPSLNAAALLRKRALKGFGTFGGLPSGQAPSKYLTAEGKVFFGDPGAIDLNGIDESQMQLFWNMLTDEGKAAFEEYYRSRQPSQTK